MGLLRSLCSLAMTEFQNSQVILEFQGNFSRKNQNSLNFVFSKYRGVAVLKASKHERRRTQRTPKRQEFQNSKDILLRILEFQRQFQYRGASVANRLGGGAGIEQIVHPKPPLKGDQFAPSGLRSKIVLRDELPKYAKKTIALIVAKYLTYYHQSLSSQSLLDSLFG